MLGPPEFAKQIRAALWRATTGNLTNEEKDAIRRGREARKKVKITWIPMTKMN